MLKAYVAGSVSTFIIFILLDFIWLSNAARLIYRPEIGNLLLEKPVIPAAVAFYLLYGLGVALLVVRPAIGSGSVLGALWMGALFGLVAYGTYDLTNMATVKGWSITVTLVDMIWGGLLTGVATSIGVWLGLKFL